MSNQQGEHNRKSSLANVLKRASLRTVGGGVGGGALEVGPDDLGIRR